MLHFVLLVVVDDEPVRPLDELEEHLQVDELEENAACLLAVDETTGRL